MPAQTGTKTKGKAAPAQSAYAKWYEANKKALAEKRKQRYKEDPLYRARALSNRKAQAAKQATLRDTLPERYTRNMSGVADYLGVSLWKLRDWRARGFYPEPHQHGREYWFTDHQAALLGNLDNLLVTKVGRADESDPEIQATVLKIATEWSI